MKISGFSYVRNGFSYGVPFLESIQSILPICDEFVIAVGDSTDGTREAILALNSDKIKIIDTIWDMHNDKFGKIFAEQSNAALDGITGDWAFHIQADEVIHENDLPEIKEAILKYDSDAQTEGFILPYLHFWGGFHHIRTSRRVHRQEVRIFRAKLAVRSYRDSQGFRKFESLENYNNGTEKGTKLKVRRLSTPVYHYTEVRNPYNNTKKETIGYFYADEKKGNQERSYHPQKGYDQLEAFTGSHPKIMAAKIAAQDWEFNWDPKNAHWRLKDRIMTPIEKVLGIRIGEYKNFIEIK
jgi:glycosyltransferase involved in cell wall biosynthesis